MRLELAAVQMPPGALRGMVVAGQLLLALRARPQAAVGMLDMDVDLRRLDVEFHFGHSPRSRQAENVLVEFRVEHEGASGGWRHLPHAGLPTRNPYEPILKQRHVGLQSNDSTDATVSGHSSRNNVIPIPAIPLNMPGLCAA